jgi:hypothetical protein
MNSFKTAVAVVTAALLAHTAAADPPAKAGGPPPVKAFAPKGAGFSVAFPGKPTPATKEVALPDGGSLTIKCYVHEQADKDNVMLVAIAELPAGAVEDVDGALDGAVVGFAEAVGVDTPESKAVVLNGHPGRAFEFEVEGKGKVRGRVYLANGRLYQVAAAGQGEFATGDAATQFLKSFKLTGPAGKRGD